MKHLASHLRAHPRLLMAILVGAVVGAAAPAAGNAMPRALLGWDAGVWFYLAWTGWTMLHSDRAHLVRVARAQAEGATTVLLIVALAALAILGATISELSAAKNASPGHAWPHVLLVLVTVVGSWLMVPALFSLNYAGLYHAHHTDSKAGGLEFPDADANFDPDYSDFLYFAFTIAVTSQTSDVSITSRPMRRLVLLQSVLSFVFNTTILAFTINIAASLI
ncbi:MAG: DUF1345 domain-containing protein [Burkholderiaceae bacterium]